MGVIKRGGRWYAKWKDASGKWVRKATTARTKQEAQQLWHSYAEQAQRQRDGLAPRAIDSGHTMLSLSLWWADNKCTPASKVNARSSLDSTQRNRRFGGLPLLAVTTREVDRFFDELLADGYAPRTINRHRALLRSIFNAARREGLWQGTNPVNDSKTVDYPKTPRATLEAHEVPLMLEHARAAWRPFLALGVYLGLRKGEICGLRKSDYNPVRRTLFVGRNYATDITKTKRSDSLPVSSELAAHLELALKTPGPWLCPQADGSQRTRNCIPEQNLRSAMRRAGLTEGWRHKCRRCTREGRKPGFYDFPDDERHRCPVDGFVLWPTPRVRDIRFHDLRHTCATLLLRQGTPIQHVMRVLRHASITQTVNTYGHLLTEDLRPFLEQLGNAGPRPGQAISPKLTTA